MALDFVRSIYATAFDVVLKVSGGPNKAIKTKAKKNERYMADREDFQKKAVERANEYRKDNEYFRGGIGRGREHELYPEEANQLRESAGLEFDAEFDSYYDDLSEATGFAQLIGNAVAWAKERVLQLGGAGEFEDVAC